MIIKDLQITRQNTLRDALTRLNELGTGILLLVGEHGRLERTVTDGDLRRLLLEHNQLDRLLVELPEQKSTVIEEGYTRRQALSLMRERQVNQLPVVDDAGRVTALLNRSDIDEQVLLSTPHMGDTELEFVMEAFRTNWIAPLGPNVDAFERETAELVGVEHAVALSSGTAAIHLALRLLDVGPGDTVFCSTLTFAASVNPVVYQGAQPVLIDSEPESWNMSPDALERAFEWAKAESRLPKAVIVVSLYGQSADMDPILEICGRYGVPVVEDAAESLGARYKGKASGTLGQFGIYSFNGNKIITTSGGGMLLAPNAEMASAARFLATQARDPAPHYQHSTIGYNYRMSNILAGVGRGQLRVLDERVQARRAVFQGYKDALSDVEWLEWMPEPEWSYSTHWLSVVAIRQDAAKSVTAQRLIERLSEEFVEARRVWKPMHLQPVFADAPSFDHGNHSVSADLFERGVCLPSSSHLSADAVNRVVDTIRSMR
ncbi:aminotransferase class I/II-fold pyridoxal phosphate-dependent enzyme [Devosia sp. Root635]|uniref:aminotransferase class I/II-fold pyridoxal phosphate-dependent enzyme n=1 Tax=Devosia sp. Root635 TaxID=1736575 RepID=UPI0006F7E3A9|nr:aminotransferase class I/II-fold pyridoxal phosphate-dependent enzyme [Devosia sp. Root635]KRA55359.1 aminotransferase [Devosia sp. Root635]